MTSEPAAVLSTASESASTAHARSVMWRAWFKYVSIAEFVGFGAPAVAGALTVDSPAFTTFGSLVFAGAVEGTILGYAQAAVIARHLPGFPRKSWTLATAAGAAFAWAAAMSLTLFADELATSSPLLRVLAIGLTATIAVLSLGTAQWFVLRSTIEGASAWIFGSAIGWCIGLMSFAAITTPLWHQGQSTVLVAGIGMLGGLVMAATMSATTGSFLTRIIIRDDSATATSTRNVTTQWNT